MTQVEIRSIESEDDAFLPYGIDARCSAPSVGNANTIVAGGFI